MTDAGTLARLLREPASMARLAPAEWDVLLRQARHAGLLARLEALAREAGVLAETPPRVRTRLEAARADVELHHRLIRWEVTRLRRILAPVPVVLLKGAAYLHADLPAARGRQFNDVDVLVPAEALGDVETRLRDGGWRSTVLTAYDDRYYREWSHELPPMAHKDRQVVVDVHHNILPPTGRLRPDARRLLAAARALPGSSLRVLAPEDMVLHCACHLFMSGELHKSLRDLGDLDALVRGFAHEPAFWPALLERARVLGVERPLFYGLRFAERLFGTPVPAESRRAVARAAPPAPVRAAMDTLVLAAMAPDQPARPRGGKGLARGLLTVRHHWLRMPPFMLLRHLVHQTMTRRPEGG